MRKRCGQPIGIDASQAPYAENLVYTRDETAPIVRDLLGAVVAVVPGGDPIDLDTDSPAAGR